MSKGAMSDGWTGAGWKLGWIRAGPPSRQKGDNCESSCNGSGRKRTGPSLSFGYTARRVDMSTCVGKGIENGNIQFPESFPSYFEESFVESSAKSLGSPNLRSQIVYPCSRNEVDPPSPTAPVITEPFN
jgi:hypothetical protein